MTAIVVSTFGLFGNLKVAWATYSAVDTMVPSTRYPVFFSSKVQNAQIDHFL